MPINIAVDGPAGSGKSTVAKAISKKLNIIYIDTGAMYRAVGLKAVRNGIGTKDEVRLTELVKDIDIKISHGETGDQIIYLDGEDVSGLIRTPEISTAASDVSKCKAVRLKLVDLQREIAKVNDVVMDGRDIGTYVLPDANNKFFMIADVNERAKRRQLELEAKTGEKVSFDEVKAEMEYRDNQDSKREFAPLKQADDAILIDTTNLSIEEVVGKVISCLNNE